MMVPEVIIPEVRWIQIFKAASKLNHVPPQTNKLARRDLNTAYLPWMALPRQPDDETLKQGKFCPRLIPWPTLASAVYYFMCNAY